MRIPGFLGREWPAGLNGSLPAEESIQLVEARGCGEPIEGAVVGYAARGMHEGTLPIPSALATSISRTA
jgi:hypothetical protein